jgi:hypothetical protein
MPEAPIVEVEGFLRKIIALAESPAHDKNKRDQIKRLAEKSLERLPLIAQPVVQSE